MIPRDFFFLQGKDNSRLGDDVMEAGLIHKDGKRSKGIDFDELHEQMTQFRKKRNARERKLRGVTKQTKTVRGRRSFAQRRAGLDNSAYSTDIARRRKDSRQMRKAKRDAAAASQTARDLKRRRLEEAALQERFAARPGIEELDEEDMKLDVVQGDVPV